MFEKLKGVRVSWFLRARLIGIGGRKEKTASNRESACATTRARFLGLVNLRIAEGVFAGLSAPPPFFVLRSTMRF